MHGMASCRVVHGMALCNLTLTLTSQAPATQDSVERAEQRRQQERAEVSAMRDVMHNETRWKPEKVVAMRVRHRNKSNPATMIYAIKWTGCGESRFATNSNDVGGLTWEVGDSFLKARGALRDSADVLTKWLAEYKKTPSGGSRGGHQHPFKKGDPHVAIASAAYGWIKNDDSWKKSITAKIDRKHSSALVVEEEV